EPATVAFRHELARQAVESTLSPPQRQALHAQVLEHLLTCGAGEDPSQAARLVHHALGAHDEALIARNATLAARYAAARGAHRAAAAHYATALAHAETLPGEHRAALLVEQAYECYLIGQVKEAEQACQTALHRWRQLARPERVGQTLCCLSRLAGLMGQRT